MATMLHQTALGQSRTLSLPCVHSACPTLHNTVSLPISTHHSTFVIERRNISPSTAGQHSTWGSACRSSGSYASSYRSSNSSSSSTTTIAAAAIEPGNKLWWLPQLIAATAAAKLGLTVARAILETNFACGGVPPFCMTTTLFTMSIGASGIVGGWTGIEYLITGSSPSLAACLYTASFGAFMGAVFSAPEHLALLMISALTAGGCYVLVSTVLQALISKATTVFSGKSRSKQTSGVTMSAVVEAEIVEDCSVMVHRYELQRFDELLAKQQAQHVQHVQQAQQAQQKQHKQKQKPAVAVKVSPATEAKMQKQATTAGHSDRFVGVGVAALLVGATAAVDIISQIIEQLGM